MRLTPRLSAVIGLVVLVLLIAGGVPLFLRMPLWPDPIQYDLAARNVLEGGVHYRDVCDINLPGMLWLHMVIRSLLGWRFETLRLVDFLMVGTSCWLLARWGRPTGLSPASRRWAVALLLTFYFATTEVCHCQRDVWILLPALGGLYLRRRRIEDYSDTSRQPPHRAALRGTVEGVLWGAAFWIKPHIAFPAAACWVFSVFVIRRTSSGELRLLATDLAYLLLGGLLAGFVGTAWLWWSGAWPYFVECCLHWTRGYYLHSNLSMYQRTAAVFSRFDTWGLAHLGALPLAVALLFQACIALKRSQGQTMPWRLGAQALLAVCYLGWFMQALFLQHAHEYAWVAPELLALALMAGQVSLPGYSPVGRLSLVLITAIAVRSHPLLSSTRLALWPACWQAGDSAILRDRLGLATGPNRARWVELRKVASYLQSQQVRDGELTCGNAPAESLYLELGVKPATRYVYLSVLVDYFPEQVETVKRDLNASRQRFVVSALGPAGLHEDQEKERACMGSCPSLDLPQNLIGVFPWSEPVVFRTEHYVVHQVTGPVERLTNASSARGQ
jgi:hypothetical protein